MALPDASISFTLGVRPNINSLKWMSLALTKSVSSCTRRTTDSPMTDATMERRVYRIGSLGVTLKHVRLRARENNIQRVTHIAEKIFGRSNSKICSEQQLMDASSTMDRRFKTRDQNSNVIESLGPLLSFLGVTVHFLTLFFWSLKRRLIVLSPWPFDKHPTIYWRKLKGERAIPRNDSGFAFEDFTRHTPT